MNKIEKQLFYKFLSLYIISATVFLLFSAFWYYTAQKNMVVSMVYMKMDSLANEISSRIIEAQMKKKKFVYDLTKLPCKVTLFDKNKNVVFGKAPMMKIDWSKKMYKKDDCDILISNKTYEHLGVKYIVIVDENIKKELSFLRKQVAIYVFIAFIFIFVIGYLLSKMFLKPINAKMEQIESFIKDTTHELNTPVTALMMSVSGLLKNKTYNEKLIKNIKISSKQLKDIYSSLVFVNFSSQQNFEDEKLRIDEVLKNSIAYFEELASAKRLEFITDFTSFSFMANRFKIEKLFNNIISNAIKYSAPNKKIRITVEDRKIVVQDEGIGIDEKNLKNLYKRYSRATEYAGGFGIGLNIVWIIAKEYGIEIDIQSELKKGTTIILTF